MDATDRNASVTSADVRTQLAYKNRWRNLLHNPKLIVIAFFASFGGFEYGYQQGVLGQSLVMHRFVDNFPSVVKSSSATGWLTSILQLGGIIGSLSAGVFGLGVGTFSGVGPLYNAELSAPELRGLLVSFYQFATILGIMLSFWIGYGSNNIGGTGEWLVKKGRDQKALETLSYLRKLPTEHELIQIEYKEIKAEALFEQRNFEKNFPNLAAKEKGNIWVREFAQYYQIVRTWDNFKRVATAWLVMFFQQWSGIDAIIYYASNVFQSLGLTGGTQALLATGVTGVVFFVSTLPAMAIIDKVGRKPMLHVGSVVMFVSMVIAGIVVAKFRHDWKAHADAGWVAVAFIWIYVGAFGATWGPVSWTLVSEIFPLSIRAKGASIGASSNWVNNFAVAFFVPPMFEGWAWGTYIFFSVFLAAGIAWVHFCLPETKGATLEEMDRVFKSRTGEEDSIMLAEARREIGLNMTLENDAIKAVEHGEQFAGEKKGSHVEVV
ncbi:quinate permease [Zopfia rhizophila CBS 207.26]|uniref:Quinate permease n=1 Tax=Zopfia rhizophila CBS 207.26 TaxID=1314779 RepID=A0A6A6DVH0_9PEZI|nr:quinate permease [Zopfia rhizophila CBS 207.26]